MENEVQGLLCTGDDSMLIPGPASKVVIHINEDLKHRRTPLWEVIMSFLYRNRVAGANVTRPVSSFGSNRVVRSITSEYLASSMRIEFIEGKDRVMELLPKLCELVTDGLIELQDTIIIKTASKSNNDMPEPCTSAPQYETARMMQVMIGRQTKLFEKQVRREILGMLRKMDIAGATIHESIGNSGTSAMICVVDNGDKIAQAAEAIACVAGTGLVLITDVLSLKTHWTADAERSAPA
jgi:uncharacterized protein